jgi:hypothetical protein
MLSRGIDFRLHWYKRHRNYIFGGSNHDYTTTEGEEVGDYSLGRDDDDNAIVRDGGEDMEASGGTNTFLAHSFHSTRHLRKLATGALTIVSEEGTPTMFLTMTCKKCQGSRGLALSKC